MIQVRLSLRYSFIGAGEVVILYNVFAKNCLAFSAHYFLLCILGAK
jgi:hypothetical protein